MLVFRLENKEDQGIYSRGFGFEVAELAIKEGGTEPECHVGPENDDLLRDWWEGKSKGKKATYEWVHRDRREWHFAFESIEQLLNWFPKISLERLKEMADRANDSMALSIYSVNARKTKKGETQMLFHMPSAQFVERISLEELIKKAK
jgi:hypothetical protein